MKKAFLVFILLIFVMLCGCVGEDSGNAVSCSSESSAPSDNTLEAVAWVDCLENFEELSEYAVFPVEYTLPEYPDITFVFDGHLKATYNDGGSEVLPLGSPHNIIFADLTGDGIRDVCVTVFESLTLPPEILAMCMGYKIRVYDPVTKTCGTAENTQTERGSIIFRVENGELYAVAFSGFNSPASFHTAIRFDSESGEISMDAVDPDYQTKVKLVRSPVVMDRCVYMYEPDNAGAIETYFLLTEEDLEQIMRINENVSWEEHKDSMFFSCCSGEVIGFVFFNEENGCLNIRSNGILTVPFDNHHYSIDKSESALYDYITSLNEDALPYK